MVIRWYETISTIFKNNEGWSKEINCNIGVKQGFLLSPTLFGIYIDKLEGFLEEVGCTDMALSRIVIILLLYANDIVLMARCPFDLDKQLRTLKDLCSNIGMIVNTDKKKLMIIKLYKVIFYNFLYDNNKLEDVSS